MSFDEVRKKREEGEEKGRIMMSVFVASKTEELVTSFNSRISK